MGLRHSIQKNYYFCSIEIINKVYYDYFRIGRKKNGNIQTYTQC